MNYPERRMAVRGVVTDRPFYDQLQFLGLDEKDLVGKKILDIGAGKSSFVEECNNRGAFAVALEPRDLVSHPKFPFVKAIGEELPFKRNSFDLIVSVNAPFFYTPRWSFDAWKFNVYESLRVLKTGGELRLHFSFGSILPKLSELFAKAGECGFEIYSNGFNRYVLKKPKGANLAKLRKKFFGG